jgi:hypothetical protein
MLVSFPDVSTLFALPSVNVELGEVPVPDLVGSPWGKNDDVVVVIFVGLLFL